MAKKSAEKMGRNSVNPDDRKREKRLRSKKNRKQGKVFCNSF